MTEELNDLFAALKNDNDKKLIFKISSLILKYSKSNELKKIAQDNLPTLIRVDLNELESLINPEKFDFPDPDIGRVEIENVN